ncbi:MAG TPA: hypothetical protein VFN68_13165 [Acidimicrobiales bacterium]|nr:hypothetical protein [Acidimicrobiales bacterium]
MEPSQAELPSFWSEMRDAVSGRTAGLILGVLAIQLLFISSYVGAFHAPTPHRVPLEVVAPAPVAASVVERLDTATGHPVAARKAASAAVAARDVRTDRVSGALVIPPTGTTDTVYVASGGGAALAGAVEKIASAAAAAQHRTIRVVDVAPLQAGDYRGLTGFYLVIGWIVGGYLVAALLGVAAGARPATTRRAVFRLLAMIPYAVVSGAGGALVVGPGIGALTGHTVALAAIGMLLVAAAAATTLAFQVLAGVLGIGMSVLVFVVAGNPSAGGAYQNHLLPGLWRVIGPALINGAGTSAVRRLIYFGGAGLGPRILILAAWAAGATLLTLAASRRYLSRPIPGPAQGSGRPASASRPSAGRRRRTATLAG